MVGNVVGQGIANLTGQQKGFSWTSVAAAGVGAAAGGYGGDKIGGAFAKDGFIAPNTTQLTKGAGFITTTSQGVAASIASQLTSITLQGGKLNWSAAAINGISAGMGYLAGGWVDPKNGGNQASSITAFVNSSRMDTAMSAAIANGYKVADNKTLAPGAILDTSIPTFSGYDELVVKPDSASFTTRSVDVTATPRPLLNEVAQTADLLMRLNAGQLDSGL